MIADAVSSLPIIGAVVQDWAMGSNLGTFLVSNLALDVVFQSSVFFLCSISSFICFRTFQEHLSVGSLPALQVSPYSKHHARTKSLFTSFADPSHRRRRRR